MTTAAPLRARQSATAAPTPREAPVTMTTGALIIFRIALLSYDLPSSCCHHYVPEKIGIGIGIGIEPIEKMNIEYRTSNIEYRILNIEFKI